MLFSSKPASVFFWQFFILFLPSHFQSHLLNVFSHPLTSETTPSSPFSSQSESLTLSSCSWGDDCTICYENAVDTVLYACGHMCLCYSCGLKLKKMSNACCPICRRTIRDIIKIYRNVWVCDKAWLFSLAVVNWLYMSSNCQRVLGGNFLQQPQSWQTVQTQRKIKRLKEWGWGWISSSLSMSVDCLLNDLTLLMEMRTTPPTAHLHLLHCHIWQIFCYCNFMQLLMVPSEGPRLTSGFSS